MLSERRLRLPVEAWARLDALLAASPWPVSAQAMAARVFGMGLSAFEATTGHGPTVPPKTPRKGRAPKAQQPAETVTTEATEPAALNGLTALALLVATVGDRDRLTAGDAGDVGKEQVIALHRLAQQYRSPEPWVLVGEWLRAHEPGAGPSWRGASTLTPSWVIASFRDALVAARAWAEGGRQPIARRGAAKAALLSDRAKACLRAAVDAAGPGSRLVVWEDRHLAVEALEGVEALAKDFDTSAWAALGRWEKAGGLSWMRAQIVSAGALAKHGREWMALAAATAAARNGSLDFGPREVPTEDPAALLRRLSGGGA